MEEKKYVIDPYVVGVFLGDGNCLMDDLTLSSNDEEIVQEICKLLNAEGYLKNVNNYNWKFNCKTYINEYNQPVNYLKTKNVFKDISQYVCQYSYNKAIPPEYKNGSIEQRLSLIQGLMDTDGSITKSDGRYHVTFTSTSYSLVTDLKEVLGSLGYISTITTDKRADKYTAHICYGLMINISNAEKNKLFRLSRKKNIALECKDKKQNRDYTRTTIRDIQDLGYEEEMTCFLVDNEEHLFLMNDFIVTHNTRTLTERIAYLIQHRGVEPKDIVAFSFTNLSAEEMKKRLGSIAEGAFIGTIHSYGNYICQLNNIDTFNYIYDSEFDKILEKALTLTSGKYPKIKHLLIDECQDLSPLEYAFIERIPTENIFYVGDVRQNIYQFRGCTDKYLNSMYHDEEYEKFFLVQNYRNPPSIIKFAESLIVSMKSIGPNCIPVKTQNGFVYEGSFDEALEDLRQMQNWGEWFILARTNNEIELIQEKLNEYDIPNVSFKKGDLNLEELDELISSDRVKVLTIHVAKGSEIPNVIVVGARMYNEEERKIAYVAATRAEQALYWCPSFCKKGKKIRRGIKGSLYSKSNNDIISF